MDFIGVFTLNFPLSKSNKIAASNNSKVTHNPGRKVGEASLANA